MRDSEGEASLRLVSKETEMRPRLGASCLYRWSKLLFLLREDMRERETVQSGSLGGRRCVDASEQDGNSVLDPRLGLEGQDRVHCSTKTADVVVRIRDRRLPQNRESLILQRTNLDLIQMHVSPPPQSNFFVCSVRFFVFILLLFSFSSRQGFSV